MSGKRHKRMAEHLGVSALTEPEEATDRPGYTYCAPCKIFVIDNKWASHPSSPLHQRKVRFSRFEVAFDEALKDKHGVSISHHPDGLDFDVIDVGTAADGSTLAQPFVIKSTVPLAKISLVEVKVLSSFRRTSPFVTLP